MTTLDRWKARAQSLGPVRIQEECGDAFVLIYGPAIRSHPVTESTTVIQDILTEASRVSADIQANAAETDGLPKNEVARELNAAAEEEPGTEQDVPQVFVVRRRLGSKVSFVSVGRMPELDIQIADSAVSRFHAHFRAEPEGMRLRDAVSSNGTFVNGKPATANGLLVKSGDELQFGCIHGHFYDAAGLCRALRSL